MCRCPLTNTALFTALGSGSINETDCSRCLLGKYANLNLHIDVDADADADVASNQTTEDTAAQCLPCPAGRYGAYLIEEGAHVAECIDCVAGTYFENVGGISQLNCSECPPGTHVNVTGSDNLVDCLECVAGAKKLPTIYLLEYLPI